MINNPPHVLLMHQPLAILDYLTCQGILRYELKKRTAKGFGKKNKVELIASNLRKFVREKMCQLIQTDEKYFQGAPFSINGILESTNCFPSYFLENLLEQAILILYV